MDSKLGQETLVAAPRPTSIPPKEELAHLLRGIEETSKHARSILFALTTTSAFVLIAALSQSSTGAIKLPIAGNEMTESQFFTLAPLLILVVYLYLQVYVQELRGRFKRLQTFYKHDLVLPSVPRDLLFPWLLVIALESREQRRRESRIGGLLSSTDDLGRTPSIEAPSVPYLFPLAVAVIWALGPVVLLILLFDFLREENALAVIPCGAFLIAAWVAIAVLRPHRSRIVSSGLLVLGTILVLITFASVPELRDRTYLSTLWNFRYPVAQWHRDVALPSVGSVLVVLLPLLSATAVGRLIYLRAAPFRAYRNRIADILDRLPGSGTSLSEYFVPLNAQSKRSGPAPFPALSVLNESRTALILGPPGAGKTTLLKLIGLKVARNPEIAGDSVPIFLRLARIGDSRDEIIELAAATLEEHQIPSPTKNLLRLANSGRITFLLDGLDEVVPARRSDVIEGIARLTIEYPKCRVYVSSRVQGYNGELDGYMKDTLHLLPLTEAQIERLLRQRFGGDSEKSAQVMQALRSTVASASTESPLIASLAAEVLERRGALPESPEVLMDEVVRVRLSEWDRVRHIRSEFTFSQKAVFLEHLAVAMQGREVAEIGLDEVLQVATATAADFGSPEKGVPLLDAALRSGLVVQNSEGSVRFVHRSFQDYFLSREKIE